MEIEKGTGLSHMGAERDKYIKGQDFGTYVVPVISRLDSVYSNERYKHGTKSVEIFFRTSLSYLGQF